MKAKLLLSHISSSDFKAYLSKNCKPRIRFTPSAINKHIYFYTILGLLSIVHNSAYGQSTTSGSAYNWSSATAWTPAGVPGANTTLTVNNPLTLDQSLNIATGSYTFNQDVTDQPGGSQYNLTTSGGVLDIKAGTTTIEGITSLTGSTLYVRNGATLILGAPGTINTTNSLQIGNSTTITIETGGTLIVYGSILNSNSNGTLTVDGLLQVYGDYSSNNGQIILSGTGQFFTTGKMDSQGSSTIYGSKNNCLSNCSGTSLGCANGTNGTAYSAVITPSSQTICSGTNGSQLTFTTNAPSPTFQWESSPTIGGSYTSISGAQSANYTPLNVITTTWYRVKYTSSDTNCGSYQYSAPVPVYVSASTFTQSTAGQSICPGGTFGPISVSAYGTNLNYQWYSNTIASNSGGTSIASATSNIYTPSNATAGTTYYYCIIKDSSCSTSFTTAISGAFIVNSTNTVSTASSTPTLCINTVLTAITHATTGATGIGTTTGLPAGVTAAWAGNTITISGTPTTSGTLSYTIPLTGGCGSVNATGTITVNPNNTIALTSAAGTDSQTVCINSAISNITYATSGATGATFSGLPTGVTGSWAGNVATISGTPSSTGGTYTITLNGGCGSINTTGVITINPIPSAPSVGTITQPTCTNSSDSVVLNGLPTGNGTWTLNPGGITGSTSTITISPLLPGTYNYTVTIGGCTSAISSNIVINDNTKTWIGSNGGSWFVDSNWSPSGAPAASDCVILSSNAKNIQISGGTAYANGLSLINGSSINITSKGTLVVTDAINIDSTSTMILDNNASLIQTNPTPNTGTITVTRSSAPSVWADYTYWSSPTHGNQTLFDFSSNSNPKYFLSYDNQWNYAYPKISNFTTGVGYAIAAPINATTTGQVFNYQFTGTPNNGDVSITVAKGANHLSKLIGNPYPSALDADKFIRANNATNGTINQTISGTLYFWTHNTQTGEADYATYNLTGSTVTAINTTTGAGNKNLPTRWIASGQGFMVEAISASPGHVIFNNDMRVIDPSTTNNNFYRNSTNTQAEPQLEKNRIWLNLSHQSQFVNQILVGYIETATNDYDPGFDGTNISNSTTRLYSLIENQPMTIQARSTPFNDDDKVALGFKTETSGNYSISLSDFDGLFTSNQGIYIEDTYLNIIQNLKIKSYDFSTNSGVFEDRFVLRFTDQTLGLSTNTKDSNTLVFLTKDHDLNVKSNNTLIQELNIFSITGQLIYSKKDINNLEATVLDLTDHQVYIAKVKMQNGSIENRKIIF